MCGIFGYSGPRDVKETLLSGLKRLEYRGYDSAGIALNRGGEHRGGEFALYRSLGGVDELKKKLTELTELTVTAVENDKQTATLADVKNSDISTEYSYGIGHTRWATHGQVTEQNAHPHMSYDSALMLVHNGIIENYAELRDYIESKGITTRTETDSELLVHYISYCYHYLEEQESTAYDKRSNNIDRLVRAMSLASKKFIGSYAILLMCRYIPDTFFAQCEGAQLLISHGHDEVRISSDKNALFTAGASYIVLGDGELAIATRTDIRVQDRQEQQVVKTSQDLDEEFDVAEKGSYETYMLKEIYEHPRAVRQALTGRIHQADATAILNGFNFDMALLRSYRSVKLLSMGTSYYAAQIGATWLEAIAKIPASAEMAAEFVGREPVLDDVTLYIVISQSGETYDTLNAVKLIQQHGLKVYGICNVVGSRIGRMTDGGCYTHSGPEIAVASTKVMSGQMAILAALTLKIARVHTMSYARGQTLIDELEQIANHIDTMLNNQAIHHTIQELARQAIKASHLLFVGRGLSYYVAQEAALKFKELCYTHASAYSASELKHGPIALIDEYTPILIFAEEGPGRQKIFSTVQEVQARKGNVFLCGIQDHSLVDSTITLPYTEYYKTRNKGSVSDITFPFLHTVVAHLIAYYSAKIKGNNIDKPRNLAKSVTVE